MVPQYLQFVLGFDALGTGLRLLPMIVGLVIGAGVGEKFAARAGHKAAIALGLLLIAAGLAVGAATQVSSPYGFVAAWLALEGLGTGAALSPAMDAVLSVLPPERSGSGTAIAMTLRQAGGAIGVAVLGSLLSESYTRQVETTGLPSQAAEAAREAIAGALAVAARIGDPALAASARAAYGDGMTLVLIICAVVAALAAGVLSVSMPGRPMRGRGTASAPREEVHT